MIYAMLQMKKLDIAGLKRAYDLFTGLGQPAQRALAGSGIQSLEQLTGYSEAEIRQLHGIGPNALEKLRVSLAEAGLAFRGNNVK